MRWRDGAACQGQYTEDFFPDDSSNNLLLQRACGDCPVRASCAIASMPELWGMWAGMSARRRRDLRRAVGYVPAQLDEDVERFDRAADRVALGADPVEELAGQVGRKAAKAWIADALR